jgi:adenylate kinase family enzyme
VKDYDIQFVSTGDVLRKEIMAKSEVGKRAEEVVANGGAYTYTDNDTTLPLTLRSGPR